LLGWPFFDNKKYSILPESDKFTVDLCIGFGTPPKNLQNIKKVVKDVEIIKPQEKGVRFVFEPEQKSYSELCVSKKTDLKNLLIFQLKNQKPTCVALNENYLKLRERLCNLVKNGSFFNLWQKNQSYAIATDNNAKKKEYFRIERCWDENKNEFYAEFIDDGCQIMPWKQFLNKYQIFELPKNLSIEECDRCSYHVEQLLEIDPEIGKQILVERPIKFGAHFENCRGKISECGKQAKIVIGN